MNVAFIPVRGGSKSIPLKNIKLIAGKPLIYWTVNAANDCGVIDQVYVSTDSGVIRETVESFHMKKVNVIDRSQETATDTASTETAMLEFARTYAFDNVFLIQATSPLLQSSDLEKGYQIFCNDKTDSVFSAVRQKRFQWEIDQNNYAFPVNYDLFHRPRRQEFEGFYVENGAFYITSRESFMKSRNRISGNIRIYEMREESYYEIDEYYDWIIVENLLRQIQYSDR